ncbi:hypothetical protein AeRB84_003203 [Aphanomyces euteiches]|nr:hypothetical protein AeRB84_003203 [Aphanomyces euteiches]
MVQPPENDTLQCAGSIRPRRPPALPKKKQRDSHSIESIRAVLHALTSKSVQEVANETGINERNIRRWRRNKSLYENFGGNQKRCEISPGGRPPIFPDEHGLITFMTQRRLKELAVTCTHTINWIKRHHRSWLDAYLVRKSLRPSKRKQTQEVLDSVRDEFSSDFHNEFKLLGLDAIYNADETGMYYEMPPRIIWSIKGGDAKLAAGEKNSYRMTTVLTIRADGKKLPLLFVIKGVPGGRIEKNEIPTYPSRHSYAVQENAWMDRAVWPFYLREVLKGDIEQCSVLLVDNFESHINDESYKIVNEELGSHLCPIPKNATSVCQPLDVLIMAPFKSHLQDLWLHEEGLDSDEDDDDLESPTAQRKRRVMIDRAIRAFGRITEDEVLKSFVKALPAAPL